MFVSQYNVYIPINDNDEYIVFNGITGALDIFCRESVIKLNEISNSNRRIGSNDFDEETISFLEERGYITELELMHEVKLLETIAIRKYHKNRNLTPTIEIIPSYECQLRCSYCFEKKASTIGRQEGWISKIISKDSVDAAFDAIDGLLNGKKKRRIGLYGGEPFTKKNKDCLEYIVKNGKDRGYEFMAATNGVDIDNFWDLIQRKKISLVRVTLNGYADSHDKVRKFSDGTPTFDRIFNNLRLLLQRDVEVQVRVDVTKAALNTLGYLADKLTQIGLLDNPNAMCFCTAVHPPCAPSDHRFLKQDFISEADLVKYLSEHPELDHVFQPSLLYSARIRSLFKNEIENGLSATFCDAQTGIYVFDPFGDIYPCNKVVGVRKNRIGSYFPTLSIKKDLARKWHNHSVHNKSECLRCRYAMVCSRGCRYLQSVIYPDDPQRACIEYKAFFDSIIIYYYKRSLR